MVEKPIDDPLEQTLKTADRESVEWDPKNEVLKEAYDVLGQKMEKINADIKEAKKHLRHESDMSNSAKHSQKNYQLFMHTLIETIQGEVFVKDQNGIYLFVNKTFGKDFGVDPKDVIGKDDFFIFPPKDAEILQKNDQQIMAGKKPVNIEESAFVRGKHVTYLTSKVPLIDDKGNVLGICGVGFDITQQKKMEEELRESKAKYQMLVEGAHDVIYTITADGIVTFIGTQIKKFGYNPEDVISKSFLQLVAPEFRVSIFNSFQMETTRDNPNPVQFKLQGKDGQAHWVEVAAKNYFDDAGNPVSQVGVMRDISVQKQSEEKLIQAKQDWERTFNAVPDLIAILDDKHRLIRVNKPMADKLGITPEAAVGLTCYEHVHGTLEPPANCPHSMLLKDGQEHLAEIHEKRLGGDFLITVTPLHDTKGHLLGSVHVARDITNRKKVEKALEESHAQLERRVKKRTEELTKANIDLKDKEKGLAEAQRIAHLGNWDWNIITNELFWSDEVFRIFGLKPQEFGATYNAFLGYVHPDDREAVKNAANRAISDPNERYDIEHKILHTDGSIRVVQERGKVTFDDDNKPIRMIGTVQDITEQKQNELNYRTVADFTHAWESWAAPDGKWNYMSPSCERISGYGIQEFIDDPSLVRKIILPEDRKLWDEHHKETHQHFKPGEIQFRIQNKNGDIRWIEHVCQPVVDDGQVYGVRASNRDITERMEAALKLQKAFKEIKLLKANLEADSIYLKEEIKLEHDYENIIGNSEVLKYVLFRAEQVAPTDTTALIMGETGTGKELIARVIHEASTRNKRPLIKVNCAALPENLIESELFGHEKGAFTSAADRRMGRFELADGGTLFLDEIGELPLDLQPKLLRVLQDGEFERLGSSETLRTDVRIIAATNRNLDEDVRKKLFRMDLWYRLNVFTITMPPLRERSGDIPLLVNYMIKKFARKLGKTITSIPSDAIAKLQNFNWPGNIRELENVIERAVIDTDGETLHLKDILHAFGSKDPENKADSIAHSMKSLAEVERDHILQALKLVNWKIHGRNGATSLLDINPNTLRGRMRKHGIQRPA